MNNYKSSTTAGLLGIFLGSVGAHDWYLGDRKKGAIHVSLFGAGLVLLIIVGAILPHALSSWTIYKMLWLFNLLAWLGWGLISGSQIWGFVDGIRILIQGDAGLAQKGYAVNPNPGMNPNMNMGMNQMNNMNGMNNMGMNNGMNGMNMNNNMGNMNGNMNNSSNNGMNNTNTMNNMNNNTGNMNNMNQNTPNNSQSNNTDNSSTSNTNSSDNSNSANDSTTQNN